MVVGGAIKVKEFYFGMRDFKSTTTENDIKELLKLSEKYTGDEIVSPRRLIVLFEDNEQRSLLVFTNKRVYKIFDDRDERKPVFNWSLPLDEFKELINSAGVIYFPNNKDLEYIIFPNKPDKRYKFEKIRFQLIDLKTQIKFLANNSTKNIDELVKEQLMKI